MLLLALDDVRVRTESVDCPWSVPIIRETLCESLTITGPPVRTDLS
jgi:hypothetical protein